MTKKKITNGDFARDTLSGFKGKVIAETKWLYGCKRFTLQPAGLNDKGQPHDTNTFDEDQLELVEEVHAKERKEGGPQVAPTRRQDVT